MYAEAAPGLFVVHVIESLSMGIFILCWDSITVCIRVGPRNYVKPL